ncbi:hypothetical protein BS17DRAFT_573052 [Gyrodon lividus]|nr:hypothetical protein BS17DRAFT_573052 [Gyrodon lividus]
MLSIACLQLVRIGGLTLAGGASFLYVKRVLTDRRRRQYEQEDRLQERTNGQFSVIFSPLLYPDVALCSIAYHHYSAHPRDERPTTIIIPTTDVLLSRCL